MPPPTTSVPRAGDSGALAYSQQPPRRGPAPDDRPTTVYADAAYRTQHDDTDTDTDDPESSPMTAAPRKSTNVLAIVALVLSFLGVTAIVGIICGHVARGQIRRRKEYGESLASAALWIGYAYLGAAILCLVVYLAIAGQGS